MMRFLSRSRANSETIAQHLCYLTPAGHGRVSQPSAPKGVVADDRRRVRAKRTESRALAAGLDGNVITAWRSSSVTEIRSRRSDGSVPNPAAVAQFRALRSNSVTTALISANSSGSTACARTPVAARDPCSSVQSYRENANQAVTSASKLVVILGSLSPIAVLYLPERAGNGRRIGHVRRR